MHSRWTIGRQAGLRPQILYDTDFMRRQDGRFGEKQRDACSLAIAAYTAPSHTALRGRDCFLFTALQYTVLLLDTCSSLLLASYSELSRLFMPHMLACYYTGFNPVPARRRTNISTRVAG